MTTESSIPARSYGCSFGCGNPYDYVVVTVADATTLFLCMPCYVRLATDMIAAVTESDSPNVKAALTAAGDIDAVDTSTPGVRRRGHNAPAGSDDPDLMAAYDDTITVDELPDEFR